MEQEKFPIADKPTLDATKAQVDGIDGKIGKPTDAASESGTTGFSIWRWLASKVVNLDGTVSSRAAASEVGTRADAATTSINTTATMFAHLKYVLNQLTTINNNIKNKTFINNFTREVTDLDTALPNTVITLKKSMPMSIAMAYDKTTKRLIQLGLPRLAGSPAGNFAVSWVDMDDRIMLEQIAYLAYTVDGVCIHPTTRVVYSVGGLEGTTNHGRLQTYNLDTKAVSQAITSYDTWSNTPRRIVRGIDVSTVATPNQIYLEINVSNSINFGEFYKIALTGGAFTALTAPVGGNNWCMYNNKIYRFGGGASSNQTGIYNCANDTSTTGANSPGAIATSPFLVLTDAVLNGKIYIPGVSATYVYDTASNTFATLPGMDIGNTASSMKAFIHNDVLYCNDQAIPLTQQAILTPVNAGDTVQVSENSFVHGTATQNISKNTVATVGQNGYLYPGLWDGPEMRKMIYGWRKSG